jgi:hypothetical protein
MLYLRKRIKENPKALKKPEAEPVVTSPPTTE